MIFSYYFNIPLFVFSEPVIHSHNIVSKFRLQVRLRENQHPGTSKQPHAAKSKIERDPYRDYYREGGSCFMASCRRTRIFSLDSAESVCEGVASASMCLQAL